MPWFGEELRRLREARGLTLEQAGELIGVTPGRLSTLESYMWPPEPQTVFKIAQAWKFRMSDLRIDLPSQEEYGSTGRMPRPAGRPKQGTRKTQDRRTVKRERTA